MAALSRSFRRRTAVALALIAFVTGVSTGPTVANDPPTDSGVPRLDRAGTDAPGDLEPAAFSVPGFQEETIFSGLSFPTAIAFAPAPDTRVFVAEKSGLIKVFDDLTDPTPSTWRDLRTPVHSYWDRGLLGLALDPDFAANGRVYVAYTYNAPPGGEAPVWLDNTCPNPPDGPGGTTDGCVVTGRVSALTAGGPEQVLVEDWCQQFPSHSMSDIVFDGEGALIVNGGDGASFNYTDYGQAGGSAGSPTPKNPCDDPPSGIGGTQTLPTAEGGALRSQDYRTTGDSLGLAGTVIRIDPMTGDAMPDNPNAGSADENTRRVIAYGLRNPFRMAVQPGTNELWLGDVGWSTWEEVNRHSNPDDGVRNFGWPCIEGASLEPGDYPDANLCTSLSSSTAPHFAYDHAAEVVAGDGCGTGGSISALAFYESGTYPDDFDGALFFGDYSRGCVWVMPAGAGGVPDASAVEHFADLATPVDLTVGPGGDLYYVDIGGGTVRRIRYTPGNRQPDAAISATPTSGLLPLQVQFSAAGSTDPDVDELTYAWDFGDNDGQFNDATGIAPSHTYQSTGTFTARVRVSDGYGGTDIATIPINAANEPPVASIDEPSASTTWSVGQTITFSGSVSDGNDELGAEAMSWALVLAHCPSTCHEHQISAWSGVATESFQAPDHEYPSHLILRLTVEDGHGATDTDEIELFPKTVAVTLQSDPSGIELTAGWVSATAPFTMTAISGSSIQLDAPSSTTIDGFDYTWESWSDGGTRVHTIQPTTSRTLTAAFSGGFDDVLPGAPFAVHIAWLVNNGITYGCAPDLYCPTQPVTREQMATFLVRSLGLVSGGSPDQFTDIADSTHRININRLAAAGITAGCTATEFCPKAPVTREQMATFLARALELSGSAPDAFTDDDGSTHELSINRLAAAGVTSGCGPGLFCPKANVTRAQMAAFLHRAFEDRFP